MSNRITNFIIAGIILGIIIMGLSLVVSLTGSDSADIRSERVLEPQSSEVTIADVRAHNSKLDCWTTVGGNVYDATSVIEQNPELTTILAYACGGDGKNVYTVQKYNKQQLSPEQISKLFDELQTQRIGILAP